MRIVSYNILDGGEGRADPLAEVIEAQRADIVALVEADHMEVLQRIARRLGMDFIHAEGQIHGVALLSRWPIVHSINHGALRPGIPCLLEALVAEPDGAQWRIGVLHLHPRAAEVDEQKREGEIEVALEAFAPHRDAGRPYLLVGDFNSNSPHQEIDPERCKPSTREEWRKNGGSIPRRVMQKLFDAGHVDVLHALHPELAAEMGTFTTQHPGQRIDYILAHGLGDASFKGAWVEQDRLAKYASDHFPVGAEIVPAED